MRFQRHARQSQEFQLAPMVDILFILLIFFIVTTSYQSIEKELSIALPDAQHSENLDQAGRDIIVNITDQGEYVINRKAYDAVSLRELLRRSQKILGATTVLIRADKATVYQDLVAVMDICAELDITRISFVTKEDE